jgi:UDP-N-acetylglucosamine 2-epimerase
MHEMPFVYEAIANTQAALDRSGCRVLVVGNDLTVEGRAGCRVAARRSVPTAVFTHGSVTAMPLHSMHCADRLLVYGEGQRRDLARLDIADERIVVCGAPSLDERKQQNGRIHPQLEERFELRQGEPWILVATSGPGHTVSQAHHERVVANLLKLSKALPEIPVVIKLHRKDRLDYYQESLRSAAARKKLYVIGAETGGLPSDILDWLQGCSLLLTGASSAAMQAMLMDVPVVTMDFYHEIKNADFIDAGATVHVDTYDALEAAVRKIIAEGGATEDVRRNTQAFLKDAFLALDGQSSDRGAAAVMELADHDTSQG